MPSRAAPSATRRTEDRGRRTDRIAAGATEGAGASAAAPGKAEGPQSDSGTVGPSDRKATGKATAEKAPREAPPPTEKLGADIRGALGIDAEVPEDEVESKDTEDAEDVEDGQDGEESEEAKTSEDATTSEDDAGSDDDRGGDAGEETDEDESEDGKETEDGHDGQDTEEDGEEGKWPKDTPEWARKQITNLRRRAREAESKVRELEAATPPPAPPIDPDNPLMAAQDEGALVQLEESYANALDWAEDTLARMEGEGAETDPAGNPIAKVGEKTYTKAQVQQVLRNSRRVLRQAPQVRGFMAARSRIAAAARQEYRWIEAPKTEAERAKCATFKAAMKQWPAIRGVANADLIVADAIEGQAMREARFRARSEGAKQEPQGEKQALKAGAPRPAARGAPPPRKAADEQKARAHQRLVEEGSVEALTDVVEGLLGG